MSSKPCKYGCGSLIIWDAANSRFIEADGTAHTKERCESLKSKAAPKPAAQPSAPLTPEPQRQAEIQKAHQENIQAGKELTQAINRLAVAIEAKNRGGKV